MIDVGAHVSGEDPVAEAISRGVDLVQIFLGPPQSWEEARTAARRSGVEGLTGGHLRPRPLPAQPGQP